MGGLISRNSKVLWPLRSPNLTPCDFFLGCPSFYLSCLHRVYFSSTLVTSYLLCLFQAFGTYVSHPYNTVGAILTFSLFHMLLKARNRFIPSPTHGDNSLPFDHSLPLLSLNTLNNTPVPRFFYSTLPIVLSFKI